MERSVEASREHIESDLRSYESFLSNPITQEIFTLLRRRREDELQTILVLVPFDFNAIVRREQSIGRAQGLQLAESTVRGRISELQQQLKDL